MLPAVRSLLLLLLLVGSRWQFAFVGAQSIPPIACPNYFMYLKYGDQFIGRITLPNISMGETTINVRFSQRTPLLSAYYGRLSLFQDQDSTIASIQNGQPISYRVDFPIPNVLPKLTRISVNNVDICTASEYSPPSTVLDLQHTLKASSTTIINAHPFFNSGLGQTPFMPNTSANQNVYSFVQPPQIQRPQFPVRSSFPVTQQPIFAAPAPQSSGAVCGREGSSLSPYLYGGSVVNPGQYPWMAVIYHKGSAGLTFLCGGSLLSSRTVITAAHCFKQRNYVASQIIVYLGRYDLENFKERGVEARDVENLIIHNEYSTQRFPDADLAILQMRDPVGFSSIIRPICLWSESIDSNLIFGQKGYIAGWGADERGRNVSPLPKVVDATIVDDNTCLRSSEVFSRLTSARTICAGNLDNSGPCFGDSGGALMMNRNGRWTLRAVVSGGNTQDNNNRECNLREYVVYCDVAKHLAWVQRNLLD